MRGRTYRYFERKILCRWSAAVRWIFSIVGAGCGWMSYRLALRGHRPVAVDLLTDGRDGLGAARHYLTRAAFRRFNADFDQLPFANARFDAVIFNASVHYSSELLQDVGRSPALPAAGRPHRDSRFAGLQIARARRDDAARAAARFRGEVRHRIGSHWQHRVSGSKRPSISCRAKLESTGVFTSRGTVLRGTRGRSKAWWNGTRPPSRFWILEGIIK